MKSAEIGDGLILRDQLLCTRGADAIVVLGIIPAIHDEAETFLYVTNCQNRVQGSKNHRHT